MTNKAILDEKRNIRKFLRANGYKKEPITEHYRSKSYTGYETWLHDHYVSVEFNNEEIMFIDGSGPFASIVLEYYAMIGFFFVHRLIVPVIPELSTTQPKQKEVGE